MPNMSYCRFENAFADLADCVEALQDKGRPNGEHERRAAVLMRELCAKYIEAYDDAGDEEGDGWSEDTDDDE